MNLVPLCGVCNNFKGRKDYKKFIHCYYEKLPTTNPFLRATVYTVKQRFVVRFSFDLATISDSNLKKKLVSQENEINLFPRLVKEATVFIDTLCRDCEQEDTVSLKKWLDRRLTDKEDAFGKNDWRCAVIRGLLAYPKLDVSQIMYNKTNPRRINPGGV